MIRTITRLLPTTAFLILSVQLTAQTVFEPTAGSSLTIAGSSTLHDWEMTSEKPSGEATITITDGQLSDIRALEIVMDVKTLKSGKGQMDNNAYKALMADQYPSVYLELITTESITSDQVSAKVKLTVAGVTRIINMKTRYKIFNDQIGFSGSHPIKFSDFNLDPPTAVLGTIRTGNDLTLSFYLILKSTLKITKS